jgi:hypothetical protein
MSRTTLRYIRQLGRVEERKVLLYTRTREISGLPPRGGSGEAWRSGIMKGTNEKDEL